MVPGIGFSLQKQYDRPRAHLIPLLHEQGFTAISPAWMSESDLSSLATCARQHNMVIQSLHGPHAGMPLLWELENELSASAFQNILRSIDVCARFDIPILVLHCWQGFDYSFQEKGLNFYFFDEIVQHADQRGVSIAFENLEGEEYLDAVMNRYCHQLNVGYCWDSGHEHCYPHKIDFLETFGNRLMMTHIHDNFGLRDQNGEASKFDDLHLLPYDGTIDWNNVLFKLQTVPKQAILNFEIKMSARSDKAVDNPYKNLSLEEFIVKMGRSARLVAETYAKDLH